MSALEGKVRKWQQQGYQCATIIFGTGHETVEQALVIAQRITEVSHVLGFPLFLELYRGSVTESMNATLAMIKAYPTLRFTADFSH